MVRLLTLSGLILLLAAPTASAGVREKILRECQEGRITGDYTPGQLRDARKNIPTDIDEYSDCRDVLARASLSGRSTGGGGGGGGGGGTAAPGGVLPGGGGGSELFTPDAGGDRPRSTRSGGAPPRASSTASASSRAPRASPPTRPATGFRPRCWSSWSSSGSARSSRPAPPVRRRVLARRQP